MNYMLKLFGKFTHNSYKETRLTAVWLAQLGERRSAKQEVAGSNPNRTNSQSGTHILRSSSTPLGTKRTVSEEGLLHGQLLKAFLTRRLGALGDGNPMLS